MDHGIPLFPALSIETSSNCHLRCRKCLRQNYPDRERVKSWFQDNYLPLSTINDILAQSIDLGFTGDLWLQHYNEPILDERIVRIGEMARTYKLPSVKCCTNAAILTPNICRSLDGVFTHIRVSIYLEEDNPHIESIKRRIESWFSYTSITFVLGWLTINYDSDLTQEMLNKVRMNPCTQPNEMLIVNHHGDYLLCCSDFVNQYALPNISTTTIKQYWFGTTRTNLAAVLAKKGGRKVHPNCWNCPR